MNRDLRSSEAGTLRRGAMCQHSSGRVSGQIVLVWHFFKGGRLCHPF
jgi:hypothetical protein